jgi:hypothetical protein
MGIDVEDKIRDGVLTARVVRDAGGITGPAAANLLAVLTVLAAKVRPVTVQSLRDCASARKTRGTIQRYGMTALACAFLIMLFSLVAFVSNHFADKIQTDITAANDLAAKLQAELGSCSTNEPATNTWLKAGNPPADFVWWGTNGPPPGLTDKDVINDLRQFAATIREIDGYTRELSHFVVGVKDPYAGSRTNRSEMRKSFELTSGLPNRFSWEFAMKVAAYQDIRDFGNNVAEKVTVYYGALATCILPVLYALLGAGAYLLRLCETQIKDRTYIAGDRHAARFLTAGIGGLVVGQFNLGQGITISPFAIAFLVGYAVDVFFTFLDGSLQMFKRAPATTPAQATQPKPN